MKKNLLILPLAVAAMGLASCNKGNSITRHSFKESNKDTVLNIWKGLSDKQWDNDGKTTMQEKKVSINVYNENKLDEVMNSGEGKYYSSNKINYTNKRTFQINWDQDTKTLFESLKIEGANIEFPGTVKMDYEKGVKLEENKWRMFKHDNIVGSKYINKEKPSTENDDFNTNCVEALQNDDELEISIDPLSISSYDLMVDITGEELYNTFLNSEENQSVLDRFEAKNITAVYGSNNDNSAMITIKGKLDVKDFVKAWLGSEAENVDGSGEVNFDYYFAIENNFLSQCEFKVQYNNCKIKWKTDHDKYDFESINGSSYTSLEADYKSNKTTNIDLTGYVNLSDE